MSSKKTIELKTHPNALDGPQLAKHLQHIKLAHVILKLFPAAGYGSNHIKSCKAILPEDCKTLAVGGVGADDAFEWLNVGIDGFGIGTEIYAAGYTAEEVSKRAQKIVKAIQTARKKNKMATAKLIDILNVENELGEGIIWDAEHNAVWWTDIESCLIYRYLPASKQLQSWSTPERLACFALIAGENYLIAGFESGFAYFDPESRQVNWLHKIEKG